MSWFACNFPDGRYNQLMIILMFPTPQYLCLYLAFLYWLTLSEQLSVMTGFLDMFLTLIRRLQVFHQLGMVLTLDLRSISDQSSILRFLFTKRYCEELVLSFSWCLFHSFDIIICFSSFNTLLCFPNQCFNIRHPCIPQISLFWSWYTILFLILLDRWGWFFCTNINKLIV